MSARDAMVHHITHGEIINLLRGMLEGDENQTALARRMKVSPGHLSRVLSGEKMPGPKVLYFLGYREITLYEMVVPRRGR